MKRLIMLEPRIRSSMHHFFHFLTDLVPPLREREIQLQVVVSKQINDDTIEGMADAGIDVVRGFDNRFLSSTGVPIVDWPIWEKAFAKVARQRLREARSGDMFCSPAVDIPEAIALTRVLSDFPGIRWVCQFYWDSDSILRRPWSGRRVYNRTLKRRLHRHPQDGGLVLAAHSEDIAERLEEVYAFPVAPLPYPVNWTRFESQAKPDDKFCVGFVGDMRPGKGFRQFAKAVPLLKTDPELFIQANARKDLTEKGALEAAAELRNQGKTLYEAIIPPEEFADVFAKIDCIALPYPISEYGFRTSSLLVEALGQGIIPVVPAGTWLGRLVSKYELGPVYDDYSPQGLARAIDLAVSDREKYGAAVKAFAPGWREENSAEAFIDGLLKLLRPEGA